MDLEKMKETFRKAFEKEAKVEQKLEHSFSGEIELSVEEFINLMSSIGSDYEPIDEEALEGEEEELEQIESVTHYLEDKLVKLGGEE